MAVKYLSEEWIKEVNNRLQSNEAVASAAKGQNLIIQNVITDTPDGEKKTFLRITDGAPEIGLGEVEGAEATVTQNYETSVAVAKGELNSQAAFMQGKIKVQGNMMKLMTIQPFLQALGKVIGEIETEF